MKSYKPEELEYTLGRMLSKDGKSLNITDCSGFVTYIIGTLHFVTALNKTEYTMQDIGKGIGSVYSRFLIDHKLIGEKFRLIDSEYDFTLAYLNENSMDLREKMIEHVLNLKNSYAVSKRVYDLTAIFAFFEAPELKLEYYVEGRNVLKDWQVA